MLTPVSLQRVRQERFRVRFFEVRRPVHLGDIGLPAADDHTIATLVEYLGGAGQHGRPVEVLIEANPHEAGHRLRRVADQPPGYASGLVVEGGVEVPRAGRLVLQSARLPPPAFGLRAFRPVRRRADDLDRLVQVHRLGFQQVMEDQRRPGPGSFVIALLPRQVLAVVDPAHELLRDRADDDVGVGVLRQVSGLFHERLHGLDDKLAVARD